MRVFGSLAIKMTQIHEVQQLLEVETPHGRGFALFIIDYGPQANTCWVVASKENGRIRHYDSNNVALVKNYTFQIGT